MTKYSAWPMLGVLIIVPLEITGSHTGLVLKRALTVALLTIMFIGIILFWKGEMIRAQIDFLRTYQLSGLKNGMKDILHRSSSRPIPI